MKILYIEDELTKHKYKIKNLFEQVLSKKINKKLKEAIVSKELDSTEIKTLINSSGIVDIATTFPEALDKIVNHRDDYAFFIVDRNLSETEICNLEDIQKACPEFTEDLYNRYCGDRQREGDYVLYYLSNNGIDCLNQFFMLTANKDELTEKETLEDLISVKKFKEDNIIIKDDLKNEDRLKSIISNRHEIMIRVEHPEIFLLENIPEIRKQHAAQLINILLELKTKPDMNKALIAKNLGILRSVVVGLLNDINDIDELRYYVKDDRSKNTKEGTKIEWLEGKKAEFLKPYFRYVYDITSGLILHEEQKKEDRQPDFPTLNSLNSAICAMKDVFKWISLQVKNN